MEQMHACKSFLLAVHGDIQELSQWVGESHHRHNKFGGKKGSLSRGQKQVGHTQHTMP